jgi:DNA-binding GntR family transcriptional regulator
MARPGASTPACAILRDRLPGKIVTGAWGPGTHRTLGASAGEHGVPIGPVRDVLPSLVGEGLVQMRQHRRAVRARNPDADAGASVRHSMSAMADLLQRL